ncbi:mercuric transporter MerT family protein [Halobacteriovorax sp.]|uniref:mercuric transporter MerT family protein n=1 Tax=Halobacteriovorax sp. TaxID=2020862 RepID=UPI00356AF115
MKGSNLIKWITSGGVIGAVASSICCVGPIVLGAIGVGGASSLLFLEEYRNIILVVVTILITIGWIMNYRLEKRECSEGKMCADSKQRKIRRISLTVGTFIAVLSMVSPILLTSISQAQNQSLVSLGNVKTLYIEGMTCGGCELGVRKALKRAGLTESEILNVDHSSPKPKENIGSAVIKISDEAGCKVIKEIKESPGYLAFWTFDNKKPCGGSK